MSMWQQWTHLRHTKATPPEHIYFLPPPLLCIHSDHLKHKYVFYFTLLEIFQYVIPTRMFFFNIVNMDQASLLGQDLLSLPWGITIHPINLIVPWTMIGVWIDGQVVPASFGPVAHVGPEEIFFHLHHDHPQLPTHVFIMRRPGMYNFTVPILCSELFLYNL